MHYGKGRVVDGVISDTLPYLEEDTKKALIQHTRGLDHNDIN